MVSLTEAKMIDNANSIIDKARDLQQLCVAHASRTGRPDVNELNEALTMARSISEDSLYLIMCFTSILDGGYVEAMPIKQEEK